MSKHTPATTTPMASDLPAVVLKMAKRESMKTTGLDPKQVAEFKKAAGKIDPKNERKRILITGCNSLVGQSLFQQMRNDDVMIKTGGKAH